MALGPCKTSQVSSVYAEANEHPLYTRKEKLALQYSANVIAKPTFSTF